VVIGGCGAIENKFSDVHISNCTFSNNDGDDVGGAICNYYFSSLTIINSNFSDNYSHVGGAIFNSDSDLTITNCVFQRNDVGNGSGGAIFNNFSSLTIMNSIFFKNEAYHHGGAISNENSSLLITNSTFYGNITYSDEGGAINNYDSPLKISNSILWGNGHTGGLGPEIINEGPTPLVEYSDIEEGYPGKENIDLNPLFADPEIGDFHLLPGSPCINAGTSVGAPNDDIDGKIRPQGVGFDMGADEYVFNIPDIMDFFDNCVNVATIVGIGPGNSATNRLNVIRNMLMAATNFIGVADYGGACLQLDDIYNKCDGLNNPPDFVAGDSVLDLADMINNLMVSLACE